MRKIYFLLLLLPILFFIRCNKNNESIKPENLIAFDNIENYSDTSFRINDIFQLGDSSYLLTGGVSISKEPFQNLIMKYDKSGKRIWINIKSHSDSPKGFSRVTIVNQNKYSAYRDKGFAYDPAPRIVDYDSKGKLIFQNFVNTSITMHGLTYVNGKYYLAGEKNKVMAFQKLDPDGTSKWLKFYQYAPAALSISQLSDSNFVCIGGGNSENVGYYLLKLNNKGDTIWTKPYKGFVVQGLPDGDFLAISGTGQYIEYIRFDKNAEEKWKNQFTDASPSSYEAGCFNILGYNSKYFMFTMLKDDGIFYLYEYDESGNPVNTLTVNDINPSIHIAITKTLDEGFIAVKSSIDTNPRDLELIKYSHVTP